MTSPRPDAPSGHRPPAPPPEPVACPECGGEVVDARWITERLGVPSVTFRSWLHRGHLELPDEVGWINGGKVWTRRDVERVLDEFDPDEIRRRRGASPSEAESRQ